MKSKSILGVAALLTSLLVGVPAKASTQCTVAGKAGEYQVRKVTLPPGRTPIGMRLDLDDPFAAVTSDSNWATFGGIWVLGSDLESGGWYIFLEDHAYLAPPHVNITVKDTEVVDQQIASTDVVYGGRHGKIVVGPDLGGAQTYYVVGFGTGAGDWSGTLSLAGAHDCPVVSVPGRVLDFDAHDFTGGTHVLTPTVSRGEGIKMKLDNPYSFIAGGLFSLEPAPFTSSLTVSGPRGTGTTTQDIRDFTGLTEHESWNFTAHYFGYAAAAPLLRVLQVDLPRCPTGYCP